MTQLAILEYPDPRLRHQAEPVHVFDDALRQFVADLLETMYGARGIGLAASQVDVHRRVLVIDVSEERNRPLVFVNPEIIAAEGLEPAEEGCLSLPGIFDKVKRAPKVRVRAQDAAGAPFEMDAAGLLAVCIQHEMDHLEGKLFVDHLSELKRQLIRKRLQKERKQRSPSSESRATAPAL
jgi:peptide deformylase